MKVPMLLLTSLTLLQAGALRHKIDNNKELSDTEEGVKVMLEIDEKEKMARIELIDEILKFYQETLKDLKSMRRELTEYLMPTYENNEVEKVNKVKFLTPQTSRLSRYIEGNWCVV